MVKAISGVTRQLNVCLQHLDSERSPPSFFSQEEQKLLIQTFFDDKIQRMLDGTCRDKQVYARIAEKLGEAGYERTASVKTKSTTSKPGTRGTMTGPENPARVAEHARSDPRSTSS